MVGRATFTTVLSRATISWPAESTTSASQRRRCTAVGALPCPSTASTKGPPSSRCDCAGLANQLIAEVARRAIGADPDRPDLQVEPWLHLTVHFEAEHHFGGPAHAVAAVLADPAFYLGLAFPDLSPPELLEDRKEGDTVALRLRYEFGRGSRTQSPAA